MHRPKTPNIEWVPVNSCFTDYHLHLTRLQRDFCFHRHETAKTDAQERRGGARMVAVDALYGRNSGIPHARGS